MSIHSYMDEATCWAEQGDQSAVDYALTGAADERRVARTTAVFAALSDPTRFRILDALSRVELCVCDLAAVAGISQSGASHQLRLLRDRGLVMFHRQGQRAVYRLADEHVRILLEVSLQHADEDRA